MNYKEQKRKIDRQISMATIQISSYIRTSKSFTNKIALSIAMSVLSVASNLEDLAEAKRLITIAKNMAKIGEKQVKYNKLIAQSIILSSNSYTWDDYIEMVVDAIEQLEANNLSWKDINSHNYPKLYVWLQNQITKLKNNELSPVQYRELLSIIPDLKKTGSDTIRASIWMDNYKELKKIYNITGEADITQKKNPKIYAWVVNQRVRFKAKKLSPRRVFLLNKIHFKWVKRKPKSETPPKKVMTFNQFLKSYAAYQKKFNTSIILYPKRYPELMRWTRLLQKALADSDIILLPNDRINLLNYLDFPWFPDDEDIERKRLLKHE